MLNGEKVNNIDELDNLSLKVLGLTISKLLQDLVKKKPILKGHYNSLIQQLNEEELSYIASVLYESELSQQESIRIVGNRLSTNEINRIGARIGSALDAVTARYSIENQLPGYENINITNRSQRTVLHNAILKDSYIHLYIKLLINKGADKGAQDLEGKTPLHYAIIKKVPQDIIELFAKDNPKINARDISGKTALQYAIELNQKVTADFLMKNGANFSKNDITNLIKKYSENLPELPADLININDINNHLLRIIESCVDVYNVNEVLNTQKQNLEKTKDLYRLALKEHKNLNERLKALSTDKQNLEKKISSSKDDFAKNLQKNRLKNIKSTKKTLEKDILNNQKILTALLNQIKELSTSIQTLENKSPIEKHLQELQKHKLVDKIYEDIVNIYCLQKLKIEISKNKSVNTTELYKTTSTKCKQEIEEICKYLAKELSTMCEWIIRSNDNLFPDIKLRAKLLNNIYNIFCKENHNLKSQEVHSLESSSLNEEFKNPSPMYRLLEKSLKQEQEVESLSRNEEFKNSSSMYRLLEKLLKQAQKVKSLSLNEEFKNSSPIYHLLEKLLKQEVHSLECLSLNKAFKNPSPTYHYLEKLLKQPASIETDPNSADPKANFQAFFWQLIDNDNLNNLITLDVTINNYLRASLPKEFFTDQEQTTPSSLLTESTSQLTEGIAKMHVA